MVKGLGFLDRAAEILRERCTGVVWELDTAMIFGLWARFYLGEFGELSRRFHRFSKEALDRGDRYMESTLGVYPGVLALLAEDAAADASALGDQAIDIWTKHGFHVQHLTHYYGKVYIDLYNGDGQGAWKRVVETKPLIDGSLLPRIQHVRTDLHQIAGRAAVAAAESAPVELRAGLLGKALASARGIEAMKVEWGSGIAMLIRAAAASILGNPEKTVSLLREAVATLDRESSGMFAAAARRRLAEQIGGDEARSLFAHADAWMASQNVRNYQKMTQCLAPGFRAR